MSTLSEKRNEMLRYLGIFFLCVSLFLCRQIQAEDSAPRKIILLEQAKQVSERDVKRAAESESEKNADGGYNANVRVVDCFAAMEYHYTGGRYVDKPIRFRMLSPETIKPRKKYPLIIWFHGMGESGNDNTRQLSHVQSTINVIAGKNKLDFFMIVTQCPPDNKSWENSISKEGKGDASITIAEEIFDTVIQEYPIDTNALGVFGVCSGGNAAWNFAAKHPGRFAAMAACSSSPSGNPQDFQQTAIWAFNNKDDSASWETMEQFINSINAVNGNAYVTLKETGGHDSWTNALYAEEVIRWMLLQNLKRCSVPQGTACYYRTSGNVFGLFGLPIFAILSVLFFPYIYSFYRKK
ncbi:MAG: dienelactone hydrolase family protein [Planctomycetaceae bacterium]|jgi:predicted peptidase|nr:dienelactone hydrolase family protein [Planctomycetaceae bacterium]